MPFRPSAATGAAILLVTVVALVLTAAPVAPYEANMALAITVLTIGLWATSLLPEYLTALIFFTLVMLLKVAPPAVAFAGFASSALWMIFAGLILGSAMEHCGLARRLARGLSTAVAGSYPGIIAGVIGFAVFLSFLMPSAMGRVVLMIPIIAAIADQFGYTERSRGRTGIMLAAAYGAFLPAFGILPSNVPNMVLTGSAEALYQTSPTYGAWLLLHFPVLGIGKALVLGWLVVGLYREPPGRPVRRSPAEPWTPAERRLAVLLGVGLGLWATDFLHHITPAWIGLVMAIVCLFPGSGLMARDAFPARINLAPLFYVAGIISLGAVVSQTGLGAQVASRLLAVVPLDPSTPGLSFASVALAATGIGLFATLPGIPAILTPMASDLTTVTGLPLMTVLMLQVLGFSTVILPYQSPPLMVALRLAGAPLSEAARLCLVVAAVTLVLLLPLDFLWWRLLAWI